MQCKNDVGYDIVNDEILSIIQVPNELYVAMTQKHGTLHAVAQTFAVQTGNGVNEMMCSRHPFSDNTVRCQNTTIQNEIEKLE